MTVTSEESRTSVVGAAAANQEVDFTFPIAATSDLIVMTRVTATGVEATLDETSDYTVSIDGDDGGTVTVLEAVANTSQIHVIRNTPMTQALDLEQGGSFNAENIEDAVDKSTKLIIENADSLARCLRMPETDDTSDNSLILPSSADRASKYLVFSADGTPTVSDTATAADATVSDYGKTLIDDANAAAARTTLGLGTVATLASSTDGTLAGNSDTDIPTEKAVKTYVDAATAGSFVGLAGDESVAGIKTFTSTPVIPVAAPTANAQASNKKYVDDTVAAKTSGSVLQMTSNPDVAGGAAASTTIPYDDSKPQITEGVEYRTKAFTPKASGNKLLINYHAIIASDTADRIITFALFHDTDADAIQAVSQYMLTANKPYLIELYFIATAAGAVPETFSIRGGPNIAGSLTVNGVAGGRILGGSSSQDLTIIEIKA